MQVIIIEVKFEKPTVLFYLVKRFVEKNGHCLRLCRRTVRMCNVHCPFFFLSGNELVTECCPSSDKPLVWQRLPDGCRMTVHDAVFYPCVTDENSISIFIFVFEIAVMQAIADNKRAFLNNLVASNDVVINACICVGSA